MLIEECDLSVRTTNALKQKGIYTLQDLQNFFRTTPKDNIGAYLRIGRRSQIELVEYLYKLDVLDLAIPSYYNLPKPEIKWYSVEEKNLLPPEGKLVLAIYRFSYKNIFELGFAKRTKRSWHINGKPGHSIIYWSPLPKFPEQELNQCITDRAQVNG